MGFKDKFRKIYNAYYGLPKEKEHTLAMSKIEDGEGKKGWNINPNDLTTVRRYFAGRWSDPVNSQVAQLDYLHKIENHLDRIRWRLGFIVFVILLSMVLSLLALFTFASAFTGN